VSGIDLETESGYGTSMARECVNGSEIYYERETGNEFPTSGVYQVEVRRTLGFLQESRWATLKVTALRSKANETSNESHD
jgi:hypothetical protein